MKYLTTTKNLFDKSVFSPVDDVPNATLIDVKENGWIVQGNFGSTPGYPYYSNGWFRPGSTRYDIDNTGMLLPKAGKVTVSAYYTVLENNSIGTAAIYLYGKKNKENNNIGMIPDVGIKTRLYTTFDINDGEEGIYYPIFTLNSSKILIEDIQVEYGTTPTDYVPYGYLPMYKGRYKVSDVCQLLDKSKYPATQTINGVTFTNNGDGSITANGTATKETNLRFGSDIPYTKNHITLIIGTPSDGTYNNYYIQTTFGNDYYGNGQIKKQNKDLNSGNCYITVVANTVVSNLVFKPQLFDLTEMFGAGNEPTTVAEFKEKFPDDLYPYSPYCWAKMKQILTKIGTENDDDRKKIYGVDNVGQSAPTLARTDDAVGLTYTIGSSEIRSDFDTCFPWCEMKEVVDEYGNAFIRIPKFYTKITKNTDRTYKHQISGCRYDGFGTLFVDGKGNEIDYILVGKYEGSSVTSGDSNYDAQNQKVKSKSGQTVLTNITRGTYRTYCRNVGKGYQQYDFLIDAIIKELFMIEFATTNSQAIMYGYTNRNQNVVSTGTTDSVVTPTGSPTSNTDGKHACKYRGIENPFGNINKWCDGFNFDNGEIYICEDPEFYADDKYTKPYIHRGYGPTKYGGYIQAVVPFSGQPLLGFVTAAGELGNTESTYYCDNYYRSANATVLVCGGTKDDISSAGLWCWSGGSTASSVSSLIGGRLCYKPDKSQDWIKMK